MGLLKLKRDKLLKYKEELKNKRDECNDKQPLFKSEDSDEERHIKQRESQSLHMQWESIFQEEKKVDAQIEMLDELIEKFYDKKRRHQGV